MNTASITPADLTITPRDRRFGRDEKTARWWHGGDPFATALYNALSATFPKGEAFFVESVRRYMKQAPAKLQEEIKSFTTQEVIHSREHSAFNQRAVDAGYDMTKLDEAIDARLELIRSEPEIASLAATMVLEHYTAILAHELLANPAHLEGADKSTADLWRWHAAEEIEHKGVAYDTWLHATKNWGRFKRWWVKTKVMLLITSHFFPDRLKGTLELLRQDGITGPKAVWGVLRYALVKPGVFRKILGAWAAFFMPGFHPWKEDDRELIEGFELSGAYGQEPARTVRRAKAA